MNLSIKRTETVRFTLGSEHLDELVEHFGEEYAEDLYPGMHPQELEGLLIRDFSEGGNLSEYVESRWLATANHHSVVHDFEVEEQPLRA